MPALVATRDNKDMKTMYQRLIAKGKPPKIAITAIMRKLIILANTLVKQGRIWIKKRLDQNGYSNLKICYFAKDDFSRQD